MALQQLDGYRIIPGSALIAFVGAQWYLPYLRLAGKPAANAVQWHGYLGVLAPTLLYLHSVSLGFAYTVALSSLFVLNTLFGSLDKSLISKLAQCERFQRIWLFTHVPSSCLVTALALIHMVYALAYT
jgi:sulfoxide reductase heme-binding subunit YedZ